MSWLAATLQRVTPAKAGVAQILVVRYWIIDMLEIVLIYREDAPSSPFGAIREAWGATSPARRSLPADP
jgi:hypothetical protein